ncbi:unnamed protein product [Linum tenue]|uniref:Uncharacterized protein n=1 Tax=Linum tenue TaxID=586396 RepID=A0AAV0K8U0_9ROSI|nr:unnamed protein product [Linum tenue]
MKSSLFSILMYSFVIARKGLISLVLYGDLAQLSKLPKNLMAKASTMKNTGQFVTSSFILIAHYGCTGFNFSQILEQLPQVISTLDAHMENGLQSAPHLRTVSQILANMENCQLSSLSSAHVAEEGAALHQPPAKPNKSQNKSGGSATSAAVAAAPPLRECFRS